MEQSLTVLPLSETTWEAYADLIERHGGVWGGCWCMGFHPTPSPAPECSVDKRTAKWERVRTGNAHAAVVFDGGQAVGWCQFGPDGELDPGRKFKRHYWPGLAEAPDWRITCFFVDRKYRGRGVSSLALDGALQMIRELGGGVVEAYPEAVEGRKMNMRFVYLGTVPMFEKRGFDKIRLVAKHHWVMRTTL